MSLTSSAGGIVPVVFITWKPQADVTVYDLALCVRWAAGIERISDVEFELLPLGTRKHFQILYDAKSVEAARWARSWSVPGYNWAPRPLEDS